MEYITVPPVSSGIDMKKALTELLYGNGQQIPRGQYVVHQSLQRDSDGLPVTSEYAYKLSQEGRDENRGAITTRTGFLCSESLIRVFIFPSGRSVVDEIGTVMGRTGEDRAVIFSDVNLRKHDTIITLVLDENGVPVNPVTSDQEFIVTIPYPKKLDFGRNEFYVSIAEIQK